MTTKQAISMSNMNIMNVLGAVLPDGTVAESLYCPESNEIGLLVKPRDGEVKFTFEYEANGTTYRPLMNRSILKGRILLPSDLIADIQPLEILDQIRATIRRYVEIEPIYESVASRYVLMTWVYDRFQRIPYLRVLGPWASGKTRFLTVIAAMTYHSSRLGVGLTPANIYRWLENYPGTLILDEADFPRSSNTSMITQILNGGYDRDGVVYRCEPGVNGFTPTAFSAFGPKIIAGRNQFEDDALESRFLTLLSRQMNRDDIPSFIPPYHEWEEMTHLRNCLLGYRVSNYHKINPAMQIDGLNNFDPRFAELITPLILSAMENRLSDELNEFSHQQIEERMAQIGLGDEGVLVEVILSLSRMERPMPFVKDIAYNVNLQRRGQYPLSPKRIGGMIKGIGLSTHRTARGYELVANEGQLKSLSRRYGIPWNPDNRFAAIMP